MDLGLAILGILRLNTPEEMSYSQPTETYEEGGPAWHWTGSGILLPFLILLPPVPRVVVLRLWALH